MHLGERLWQRSAVKVLRNERIIRDLDAELHSQKKGCGRFAGTGNTDEDHLGLIKTEVCLAVIMCQRVVDGRDAAVIVFLIPDPVRHADLMRTLHAEFFFQRVHEAAEKLRNKPCAFITERVAD